MLDVYLRMCALWYLQIVEVSSSWQVAEQDGFMVHAANEDLRDDTIDHGDHDGSEAHQEHVPVVEIHWVGHRMYKVPTK